VDAVKRARSRSASGFTLIEVLVVLLIIGIVIGVVAANLLPGTGERAREEAQRLVLVLQTARQEALLNGSVYAFAASAEGYRFLRVDGRGRLASVDDDELLRARRLPAGVRIVALRVEGAGDAVKDGVLLSPTGELPDFVLVLEDEGARWQIVGRAQGEFLLRADGHARAG
jgi:general secretion pathway protein H